MSFIFFETIQIFSLPKFKVFPSLAMESLQHSLLIWVSLGKVVQTSGWSSVCVKLSCSSMHWRTWLSLHVPSWRIASSSLSGQAACSWYLNHDVSAYPMDPCLDVEYFLKEQRQKTDMNFVSSSWLPFLLSATWPKSSTQLRLLMATKLRFANCWYSSTVLHVMMAQSRIITLSESTGQPSRLWTISWSII